MPAEMSVKPALRRGYLAEASTSVCAQLGKIAPASSAGQAATSAARTEF